MTTEVADITVQKVWEPFPDSKTWRDGKKRGKVVSAEGDNYLVAETMLREFGVGRVYKVEFKTFGDKANPGKEIIKKIWQGEPKPPIPIAAKGNSNAIATPGLMGTAKDRMIFVCGAYNHALANSSINPFELSMAERGKFISEQMTLYDMTLGKKPAATTARPSLKDEMQDEVPNFEEQGVELEDTFR